MAGKLIRSAVICKFLWCVQSLEIRLGDPSFVAALTLWLFGWKGFVFAPKAPAQGCFCSVQLEDDAAFE